jgi:hypothetical protein
MERLLGLSAAGLERLLHDAGGRARWEGKSTDTLKSAFVKPHTSAARCSYAHMLAHEPDGAALVGPATAFLSHTYGNPFLDTLDAFSAWEAEHPLPGGAAHFVYIDLLVVNQNAQHGKVTFEELRDEFGHGVRDAGNFLLVLDYRTRASLARAWCVFEAATAVACGSRFFVALTREHRRAFIEDLTAPGGRGHPLDSLANLDTENATAREADDLEHIKRMISQELGGFGRVNTLVAGALREWMIVSSRAVLESIPKGERELSTLQTELAKLLASVDMRGEARALLEEARAATAAAFGEAHERTLLCDLELEKIGPASGEDIIAKARDAVRRAHEALGPTHVITLRLTESLVGRLRGVQQARPPADRDLSEPLALCEALLVDFREAFGSDAVETLPLLEQQAIALFFQAEAPGSQGFSACERVWEAIWEKRRELAFCGRTNMVATHAYLYLLRAQNKWQEALELSREKALTVRRVIGDCMTWSGYHFNDYLAPLGKLGLYDEMEGFLKSLLETNLTPSLLARFDGPGAARAVQGQPVPLLCTAVQRHLLPAGRMAAAMDVLAGLCGAFAAAAARAAPERGADVLAAPRARWARLRLAGLLAEAGQPGAAAAVDAAMARDAGGWVTLCDDGQPFALDAAQDVRFGLAPDWVVVAVAAGEMRATAAALGCADPCPGAPKVCQVRRRKPPPGAGQI